MDRRNFLAGAAIAAAVPVPAFPQANRKIRLGVIGMGRRGRNNLRSVLKRDDMEVVAISEVYKPHVEMALEMVPGAKVYPDFRELIAASDIDAVLVTTPDHWHAYMTVEACKAGKDVYVEKPISVTVHEGQMMVKAARKYNRVVQVGTQQRSGKHFQDVAKLIQDGRIGDIGFVRTWNYSNQTPGGIGNPADKAPPADLDWDMWLGPAPERAFNENRFGVQPDRYSDFRWFWDYAGGMMTDWGIHLLDIVLMAMEEPGPIAVTAAGGKYVIDDNRETPDTILATFEFPEFSATYENRITNGQSMFDQGYGILFHGTEGTMFVDRQRWEIVPERRAVGDRRNGVTEERMAAYAGRATDNSTDNHWDDFVKAIRSRDKPICDILIGHRSTTTALLGNVALRSRQRVDWDPVNETTNNKEAQTYLKNEYRDPWKLEL